MQLIEIIQLALLFFIALSVIIFLFSYLGYKSKSKIKDLPKPKSAERKETIRESKFVENLTKKSDADKPKESVKLSPKFEVFTPVSDDKGRLESEKSLKKKAHFPKTLIIRHKS